MTVKGGNLFEIEKRNLNTWHLNFLIMKIFLIILLISGTSAGSYYYYQHTYVDTLMLSEIVGHSDDSWTNIAVNFLDFDTGLTRHDINRLKSSKDYWLKRIQEVDAIQDIELKTKENGILLAEMIDDPTIKKILKGTFAKTSDFIVKILGML